MAANPQTSSHLSPVRTVTLVSDEPLIVVPVRLGNDQRGSFEISAAHCLVFRLNRDHVETLARYWRDILDIEEEDKAFRSAYAHAEAICSMSSVFDDGLPFDQCMRWATLMHTVGELDWIDYSFREL